MDSIKIKVLGVFDILVNDESVRHCVKTTKKGCILFLYLLMHRGNAVPYSDLYEILWPNDECANPESALKTLMCRLRNILGGCSEALGKCIQTVHGAYRWNVECQFKLDAAEFEDLCAALKKDNTLTAQTREMYQSVLSIYKGNLLSNAVPDSWAMAISVYLHNLYEETVNQYLDLLLENEEYDDIIQVSRTALEIDAFNEKYHLSLMNALVKTKRNNEALMQYKHAKNIHLRYLSIQPPQGIQDFYMNIIQSGQVLDMDINSISNELREYDSISGAFVCEYAVFKEIYNLQLRSYERTKRILFLVLMMLKSIDGQLMDPLKLDDLMGDLLDALISNLRKGDTITHYSASQYALLLPMDSSESVEKVIERIKAAFYRKHRNSSVIINYRIGMISGNGNHINS